MELDVDPSTGNVAIVANNLPVLSYDIESNNNNFQGDLIPQNWRVVTAHDANGHALSDILSHTTFDFYQCVSPGPENAYTLNGVYDLGNILPAGMTATQYVNDLTGANDPKNPNSNGASSYGAVSGRTIYVPIAVLPASQTSGGTVSSGTNKTITLAAASPKPEA